MIFLERCLSFINHIEFAHDQSVNAALSFSAKTTKQHIKLKLLYRNLQNFKFKKIPII